jgi:signal transduction histidine kinase
MTIPDVIYEIDLEGNFTFLSAAIRNMGYEPGELIGRNFKEIMHPDDYPEISREIVLPQYKGKVTGDEKSPRLFDERRTEARMTKDLCVRFIARKPQDQTVYYRYVEIHSSGKWDRVVKDPSKQYLGSIGVIHDITKRRQVEEAMENRVEFERIIALLSTHFINIDTKGIDKGIHHTLQAVGEFVGVDRSYVFLYSDDDRSVSDSYEWCAQGIKPRIQDMQNMDTVSLPFLNAAMRKLEVFYAPRISGLADDAKAEKELFTSQDVKSMVCVPMIYGGKLTGFFGLDSVREEKIWSEDIISLLKIVGEIFTNAIERKITQTALENTYGQLKETQSQLYEAEKMEVIARLASGVAHEVKNPLATILMGIDYLLIKIKAEDETVSGTLSDMRTAVERADRIVRGLLDFSSISKLDMSAQDVNSVIESSLLLLKNQFDKSHVSISRDLKDKLPYVKLDKNRLEQALINILLNAVQAMGEGGQVKIRTYTISVEESEVLAEDKIKNPSDEEAAVVIDIEDNGPGIPENNLGRIFDPFFTTKRDKGGTGLGLSIVKSVVDMHKGKIEVANRKDGNGVKVTLIFRVENNMEGLRSWIKRQKY